MRKLNEYNRGYYDGLLEGIKTGYQSGYDDARATERDGEEAFK